MGKKKSLYNNSGESRIPLYAEVGKFFTPDGSFDRDIFRKLLRDYCDLLKKDKGEGDEFYKEAGEWFSSYLNEVMDYLDEKEMREISYELFRIAVDECAAMGVEKIILSPDRMHDFFNRADDPVLKQESKKQLQDVKRDQIFNAALQVFADEGYHRATMDKIASLSAVGKGSVYRRFPSKEKLLEELITEKFNIIVERISSVFSTEHNLLTQVKEMIEYWIGFIEENPIVYRLIQSEAIAGPKEGRTMFYDYLITNLPMFKERIVSLNKNGKLKTTSFYTVFYGILGFIDGVVHKWLRSEMSYPLKEEIPVILEVLFNGFVGEMQTKKHFYTPSGAV